jgi:hypothetical protein
MKITDVTVYLAKEWRTFLFVVVDTDEGIYGVRSNHFDPFLLKTPSVLKIPTPINVCEAKRQLLWQPESSSGPSGISAYLLRKSGLTTPELTSVFVAT